MIADANHSLTLGDLSLTMRPGHELGWWIETAGEGTEWGNPEPLLREIQTFLQDGAIAEVDSYGNREMTINLRLSGGTSAALAEAEAALVAEVGKRNTLAFVPPDSSVTGAGEPCVFEVVTSSLAHSSSDQDYLEQERVYTLTVTALPHARAHDLTTLTVPPPAGTVFTTLIDACTSTSGWSGSGTGPVTLTGPTVSSGAIRLEGWRSGSSAFTVTLRRTFSTPVNVADKRYIRIERSASLFSNTTMRLNGVEVAPTASSGSAAWYYCPDPTLSEISFTGSRPPSSVYAENYLILTIADITASSAPQDGSTGRQGFRSLQIGGSVRTQGSLAVRAADSLGTVILYTAPEGNAAQPPLRQYRASGAAETTDATTVSGKTSPLDTPSVFQIPAASLAPGGYQLVARVKRPGAGAFTLTWKATTRMSSFPLSETETFTVNATATGPNYLTVPLGAAILPTSQVGSNGDVQITLTSTDTTLDELWLFSLDGALTIVRDPLTLATRLWVDDATVDRPTPQILVGAQEDRSDCYDPGSGLTSWGQHELLPGAMNLFVVTSNSQTASVDVTYFKRFHTHVVGDD